ncbi:hypothetical protein NT239_14325 [Chitinibacter sp. SCUT-21]|uniref:hypothetical protein n=1 Tax=Chitinibacter sp. SCUT-21 TaxID=2970891 RepID=UPI0035A7240B
MNPQNLDSSDLVSIEAQAQELQQQSKPQSDLHQTAKRLKMLMQLELIRRGIFDRQKNQIRAQQISK